MAVKTYSRSRVRPNLAALRGSGTGVVSAPGEIVLVTEREEVVAELRPARQHLPAATSEDDVLDALAEAGEVERASMSREGWRWSTKGLGLPQGAAAEILDAVRDDR